MTELIPLDAAIAAAKSLFRLHTTGLYGAAGVQQYGLLTETAEATIRAIPTIDPAAIRETALREAADAKAFFHGTKTYKPIMRPWRDAILAMIGEKK